MKFHTVKEALQFYCEHKLKEVDEIPSMLASIDKFRAITSTQWICSECYNITDTHTGECEQCGGFLVSYSNTFRSGKKSDTFEDGLEVIDFIVDFEKMLKCLTHEETVFLLQYGYSSLQDVVKYILFEKDMRNTCENMDYAVQIIKNAEIKLRKIMIEREYMLDYESFDITERRRNTRPSEEKHLKASKRTKG